MDNNLISIVSLKDLLLYETLKMADTECSLEKALPAWVNKTHSSKIREVLNFYLEYVNLHRNEMENFFIQEKLVPLTSQNNVIKALVEEIDNKLGGCADDEVCDACLLASVQQINHYKISTYGTMASFANTLNMSIAATAFYMAENNEKEIDEQLSDLAEHYVNKLAKAPIIK